MKKAAIGDGGPMNIDGTESWEAYYAKTGTRPPRETLLFALDRFDRELSATDRRFAIDLGCALLNHAHSITGTIT